MTYPSVIYAHPLQDGGPCDGWDFQGWWHVCEGAAGGAPFTRTDLYDAVVKENERLREALRIVDAAVFNDNGDVTYDTSNLLKASRIASAALK